jgi:hypothetical protein
LPAPVYLLPAPVRTSGFFIPSQKHVVVFDDALLLHSFLCDVKQL